MSNSYFKFKQFTIEQSDCAMKVGTDGCLLGGWFSCTGSKRILDIGCGTGLISIMAAQRSSAHVTGVEIDGTAASQARKNADNSPWGDRIEIVNSDFLDYETGEKYDAIVSNPPYFQASLKNPNQQRATARHTDSLSYEELMAHAARLLKDSGVLALILPIEAESEIRTLAEHNRLYPTHITHIHSKPNKPAKRLLIALSKQEQSEEPLIRTFYIESESAPRSPEYQDLTRDFYL